MDDKSRFKFGEAGHEIIKNVIAAMIGDFVEPQHRPDEDKVIEGIERYLEGLPSLYRNGFILVLRALEMAPLAMGYRHQFSGLGREDQVKVLESFEKSGNYLQRGIILALKVTITLNYFSEPELERALGYDHRCLLETQGG